MKRAIALFLSILMVFSLVACATDKEPGTTAEEIQETKDNQPQTTDDAGNAPSVPNIPMEPVEPKPEEETRYQEPEKSKVYTNPSVYSPSSGFDSFSSAEDVPTFSLLEIPGVVTPAKKYGTLAADISTYPLSLALSNKLTLADVKALPVANNSMSSDELRQLVLDYFEMQLTFTWTPNASLKNYPTSNLGPSSQDWMNKTIEQGELYIGVPYQSLGAGNLYRWLEYYDEATGIFYLTDAIYQNGGFVKGDANTPAAEVGEGTIHQGLRVFFNQCSVASFWGWSRVINSAYFIWTADMNVRNEFIPVGFYTYNNALTIDRFGEVSDNNPTKYDTNHVIRDWRNAHGTNAMYECYAQAQPGDCLVSKGHAMMIKEVNVNRSNLASSTITVLEQIEGWGGRGTIEGVNYHLQGGVNRIYTFASLQSSNYLPFTFAEYHKDEPDFWTTLDSTYHAAYDATYGADEVTAYLDTLKSLAPVEKAEVTAKNWKSDMNWTSFSTVEISSNYVISDIFVVVKDQVGNEVASATYRSKQANIKSVTMNRSEFKSIITPNTDGFHTIHISAQLSTGELLPVASATLA